ncbi:AAA family ATPase [Clostridium beijerinckii]|nr:AAA family ATPase [Clostridium beijerinckii]
MGGVISILNNKSGVGKSKSTYKLQYELSKMGKNQIMQ